MFKTMLLRSIALCALTGCVGTVDRLIPVQGQLVDESGSLITGCELSLTEKSASSQRYSARQRVSGEFKIEFTSWAPTYSSLEVLVECPNRERFLSESYSVLSAGQNGIDIGQVLLKKR